MTTRSRARCETAQSTDYKVKIEDCEPDSAYGQGIAGASLMADVIKTEPGGYLNQLNSLRHTANGGTQASVESNSHNDIGTAPKNEEIEAFDWNAGQCPFCPLNFGMDSLLREHLKECRSSLEANHDSGRRQYVPPRMNLLQKERRMRELKWSVAQPLTVNCQYCPRTSNTLVGIATHERTCKKIDPKQRIARAQIAATANTIASVKWIRPNDKVLKNRDKKCAECRETLLDTPGANAAHKMRCKKQTQLTPRLTDAQEARHDPRAWNSEDYNWRPCKYCETPFHVKGVMAHEKVCSKLSPAVRERCERIREMKREEEMRLLTQQSAPDFSSQKGLATLLNSSMGCPYCEQTIGPFYLMDRHIQTMHHRRAFFHCTACLLTYTNIKQFETHWHSKKFCQNHGKIELRGDDSLEPLTVPSQDTTK